MIDRESAVPSQRSREAPSTGRISGWGQVALVLLLLVWAFGSALASSFEGGLPSRHDIGAFFFASSRLPPGLVLGVAAWLAWRRLPALRGAAARSISSSPPSGWAAWPLFGLCTLISVWARLSDAPDLLMPSLAVLVLALATAWAGAAGFRTMLLPALVLCLALPIPSPLDNEVLWHLQLWSAIGAEAVLGAVGLDVERVGIHLLSEDTRFLVVESCSGQRAMMTLTLVAIIMRDLFQGAGRRQWLIVAIAPLLAYLVNVARIAIIVLGQAGEEVEAADDHIGQGLATLAVGAVILFSIGHFLAGRPVERRVGDQASWSQWPMRSAMGCLFALALVSTFLSPWPLAERAVPDLQAFPQARFGWESELMAVDRRFVGSLPQSALWHRIYHREGRGKLGLSHEVSFYVAVEDVDAPRRSPWSSKLLLPGRGWELVERQPLYDYTLGHELTKAIATDGDQRAVVYSWVTHTEGTIVDSLRSLLAIERGPFARERARVVVRLAASIDDAGSETRAKQALDRFVYDFREALLEL